MSSKQLLQISELNLDKNLDTYIHIYRLGKELPIVACENMEEILLCSGAANATKGIISKLY